MKTNLTGAICAFVLSAVATTPAVSSFVIVAGFFAPTNSYATALTYAYSGYIYYIEGGYVGLVPSGTAITGTFTIDLANANPAQSGGTVGSASYWALNSIGGSQYGTPAPSNYLFSQNATWAGYSFTTSVSPIDSRSSIVGATGQYSQNSSYWQAQAANNGNWSDVGFNNYSGQSTYDSNGLPIINAKDSGGIIGDSFGTVGFNFLSVQPVPLPAAAWLFGSGLLGLIGVARRKAE